LRVVELFSRGRRRDLPTTRQVRLHDNAFRDGAEHGSKIIVAANGISIPTAELAEELMRSPSVGRESGAGLRLNRVARLPGRVAGRVRRKPDDTMKLVEAIFSRSEVLGGQSK